MKKIIIVNNNMSLGGVQKSLYNLLWELRSQYDITLYLFAESGEYLKDLPPEIKIEETKSLFRYLGIPQSGCVGLRDKAKRGFLALICRLLGRDIAVKLMLLTQPKLKNSYDCAIAFLHNGNNKAFYGGVWEFVLNRINANKKAAFIHCDYRFSGSNNKSNNDTVKRFDSIAACSDGCRAAFCSILPGLENKCLTVKNCHNTEQIINLSKTDTVQYNKNTVNLITVSRLSHEKRVDYAVLAVAEAKKAGFDVNLHIIGGGKAEETLKQLVNDLRLQNSVVFHGEQANPYRFMIGADMLLLPSEHEAAPMVIDEAYILGLPCLVTETTSSHEMVTDRNMGFVCENSKEAFTNKLIEILQSKTINCLKNNLKGNKHDNITAVSQFKKLIED